MMIKSIKGSDELRDRYRDKRLPEEDVRGGTACRLRIRVASKCCEAWDQGW